MVCNLTLGKTRYAAVEPLMEQTLQHAEELRAEALSLIQRDAAAFDGVALAYRLPKGPERSAAIQAALPHAAAVPLATAELSAAIVKHCEAIADHANQNVLSDVAVAALSARAALESARVNVYVNLALMKDEAKRSRMAGALASVEPMSQRAEALADRIRHTIAGPALG